MIFIKIPDKMKFFKKYIFIIFEITSQLYYSCIPLFKYRKVRIIFLVEESVLKNVEK